MRSSLIDDLQSYMRSSCSFKADPAPSANVDLASLGREYDKRIRLLEEENARLTLQRLSDDILSTLSRHEVTREHILARLCEVAKDQLIREKEQTIKTLLGQLAYYKQTVHKNFGVATTVSENGVASPSKRYYQPIHIAQK